MRLVFFIGLAVTSATERITNNEYEQDNLCLLADQIVKTRNERAKYFGPDKILGSGDSGNIISDFDHHALEVIPKELSWCSVLSEGKYSRAQVCCSRPNLSTYIHVGEALD